MQTFNFVIFFHKYEDTNDDWQNGGEAGGSKTMHVESCQRACWYWCVEVKEERVRASVGYCDEWWWFVADYLLFGLLVVFIVVHHSCL